MCVLRFRCADRAVTGSNSVDAILVTCHRVTLSLICWQAYSRAAVAYRCKVNLLISL